MTEERKGQIALALVKARFRDEGIRLKPDIKREIGNTAKKIGVPADELLRFAEGLVLEMLEEVFRIAGNVLNVELKSDKDGKFRGLALVRFDHPIESVQAICILNHLSLNYYLS